MSTPPPTKPGVSKVQPPKGTRDLYPEDALKRRYLEQSWRDASVRCGFEEIHGPTFETTDLYAVKSGEGILGELFQAYSGKAPEEVEQVKATGRAPYAMRPEFTPTLARMYAAKAGSLPRPCKWFTGGPYFRAERPQRGRLREFLQWNVDVIGLPGDDSASLQQAGHLEAEVLQCCVLSLTDLGLQSDTVKIELNWRQLTESVLLQYGIPEDRISDWLQLLDRIGKINFESYITLAGDIGSEAPTAKRIRDAIQNRTKDKTISVDILQHSSNYLTRRTRALSELGDKIALSLKKMSESDPARYELGLLLSRTTERLHIYTDRNNAVSSKIKDVMQSAINLRLSLDDAQLINWIKPNASVVRGLAYYTGTVFEVLAEGERAIAGGGRYDKLIELMGGPPTPAVGFAMGDVVISLLLEDKGLMPQGAELMEAVSRRPASVRPEVFVVGADDEQSDALVRRLSADLRRGVEADAYTQSGERKPWSAARYAPASGGVRPMHARVSYKSTRNLKKLLADGEKQFARLAAIVHGPDRVQLKDFDARRDLTPKDLGLSDAHAEFSVDPASPVYVGRAARNLLG